MAFWDPFEKDRKNILPALTKAIFASDADSTSVKNKKQDLPKLNSDRSNVIDVYEEMETPSLFSKMADTIASKMTGQKVDRITKSDLLNDYTVAKERQISDALKNYTGNADIPMLAGTYANQTLHPIKYDIAMNEIAPYLKENNITTDQLAKYFATQALREQNKKMQNTAADNAVGNTMLSFATNQIGNIATGAGALESLLTGEPLGSNPVVNEYGKLTPTIRGTIREDIKENADTKVGGAIGAGAYDVATGIGDQLMSLALTGGSKMGTLGLMSYGAGASNLNEQLGKDTSDTQKLATAVTSGVIEGLTEYLPLDNLFRLAKGGAGSTVRQIVRGVVGQMLSEAGEEAVSEVANTISDNIINGAQSDYSQNVNAYMAQGLSQDEANKQAIKDVAGNAIYSALIGGISGGIMGGGAIAMNALGNGGNGNNNVQNNAVPALEQTQTEARKETLADRIRQMSNPISNEALDDSYYLDSGVDDIVANEAMRNLASDNDRQVITPFENDVYNLYAESKLRNSMNNALALQEGRRMANPNFVNDADALDADFDEDLPSLRLNNEEDGRSIQNPWLANRPIPSVQNETQLHQNTKNDVVEQKNDKVEQKPAENINDSWARDLANAEAKVQYQQAQEQIPHIQETQPTEQQNAVRNVQENTDNTHTPKQLQVIKEYQNSSSDRIKRWVNNKRNGIKSFKAIPVAIENDIVADYIKNQLGLDIHGNEIVLGESSFRHIDAEHIRNPQSSKSFMSDDDLSKIGYVLENPDEVVVTGKKSTNTRLSDQSAAPTIAIRKRIDGHYYVVEAITDAKTKRDSIISAFIQPVGRETDKMKEMFKGAYQMPNALDSSSPSAHVQNASENSSFDSNINQTEQNVNAENKIDDFDNDNDKTGPSSGGSGITSEQNVSAESQPSNGIRPEASQAAYNTLGRNTEQFQSTGAQRWLTEGINQGLYDKKNALNSFGQDVLSNEMVDTMAEDLIAEDPEKLEEAIRNGEATYNPVVWQAANNLMERAWDAGNTEKARYYSMKVQSALTTPARIMQLASRKAKSTFASAVADTQALINKTNENYFKTKQGQVIHDGCQTLAKALKNIGNDYTQLKGKSIPSLNETRRGVEAELNKEASNIYKKFSEQDKEYIANLIHNGYSADELQLKLEQKLTTGHWDISDEDLNEVNRLYKLVENEDPESKAYVDNTEAAAAILAKYIPAKTLNEKITMWRYMAMLLNPTTHVRNIGSNVIFGQVLENVSDKVASVVEGVMHKAAPDLVEKTKSFTGSPRALKKACGDYLLNHKWASLTSGSDKFVDLGKGIKRQQKTFAGNNPVSKLGQFLIDFSGNTLQWEDEAAMKTKFKQAMAGFLVENGKGVEVFKSDDARDQELVKRAADYAVRKAQEATFHEKSKFAEGWKSHSEDWKKRGVVGRAISAGMEGTAPFVSTPANILKMGVKYSPAGFFDGMLKIMSDPNLKKSPAAVTEAIESLARGFTGTSIMALGYMLAANGLLRGRGKKDEVQLDKETGKQDYSIKFKLNGEDYNYTLDWAAPFSIPLFIGAELYKARSDAENNDKKDMLFDIADIASAIADPMTEMSMLQGFNNALDAASNYAKGGSTGGQFLANIGYGYASQMIPSLAGKVARTIDDTQRNTYYTGENDGTKGMLEKFYKKSANRIPGLSKTLEPVISAFGEERKNSGETLPGRLFLNFASPGYLSKEKNTALTDELYRLNEETDKAKSTLPKSADSTPYTDQPKLSEGDYTDWAKIYGQNYARMESEAVENERYQALSDDEKVDLLSEVKALANGLSKEEFKDKAQDNQYTYELESGNLKKKSEAYEYKGTDGLIDYLTIRNDINKICKAEDRSETKADRINALDSIEDMSAEDKIQYLKIMDKYTKRGNYVEQFLSPQYAYDWYRVEANGGKTNDEKIYYITKSDLPSLEKKVLISVVKMHDDEIDYHLTTGK